jgi:predicted metalloprotease
MRWQMGRRSRNVEDRRGGGGHGVVVSGGGGVLVLALVVLLMGGDPTQLLLQSIEPQIQNVDVSDPQQMEQMDFVSSVLGSTEDVWRNIYADYQDPTLVAYNGLTDTACGTGQRAMGPFYCPLDHKLYLDLTFFKELEVKLNAPGDFARAYVIAHEVGHHVQTLEGTADKIRGVQSRVSKKEANALSVKMELQADCYAGLWAHHVQMDNMLEEGDIEEALNAASQIGDDKLSQMAGGTIMPDSFTHGSAKQRYEWFNRGYKDGDLESCDTFGS